MNASRTVFQITIHHKGRERNLRYTEIRDLIEDPAIHPNYDEDRYLYNSCARAHEIAATISYSIGGKYTVRVQEVPR